MANFKSDRWAEASSPPFGNVDLETFEKGKDELNLSEFPIAVVAESARPGQLTLEFSDMSL
jgi:hypothetical protein